MVFRHYNISLSIWHRMEPRANELICCDDTLFDEISNDYI